MAETTTTGTMSGVCFRCSCLPCQCVKPREVDEQRRYEIARAVLAAMMPAAHDVCQTFDFKLRARAAVEAADALLAALEGE
jgi:hypothetical protein